MGVRAEVDTALHLTESFLSKRAKQLSLPLTTSLSLPLSISTTPAIHNYCIGTAVEVGLSNVTGSQLQPKNRPHSLHLGHSTLASFTVSRRRRASEVV